MSSPSPDAAPISTVPMASVSGEMQAKIAAFDWRLTPLGPIAQWPENLRAATDICLNNRFPMHLWWGPDLINIYNDAHIPMLGARHANALGRSARHVWADAWHLLLPQVEAVMWRGESTWNQRAHVVLQRNGQAEDAWFTWCYSPVRDASGAIVALMCVATEDTAQVLAEQQRDRLEEERQHKREEEKAIAAAELTNSTTLLRGISDSTGDIIFAKDIQGRIQFANPATLALIGKPLEQVIGKTDIELLEDEAAAKIVMENDRRILDNGVAENLEEHVPMPDGSRRVWFSQKMPYRDGDGKIVGLLGISRDITERKAVEDEIRHAKETAEAASKAKDHLLAVVSHELRTPLNPILAITSYLQTRNDLSDDLREDVDTIRRNVEQEARIIDDLLSLTRLHHGKMVLHHEAVDLHAIIASVKNQFTDQIQSKQISISLDWTAEHWHVWADPVRMQQVIANLYGNAVKFTPEKGHISIHTSTTANGRMRIQFCDSGVGIDPDVLPKLFTPFEQGEKTTTRRFGGLGLGLVIVKGIIDLHKGTITATSEGRNKGATLSLELEAMQPAIATAASMPNDQQNHQSAGKRILLVEDHQDTLNIMRRVLTSLGYVVLTAANVKQAIEKIGSEAFDLLVSDIGLPDGSGLDVMRVLREHGNTKGIALSGFGHDDDIRRSKEAGFTEHLIKPIDFTLLDSTLRRIAA